MSVFTVKPTAFFVYLIYHLKTAMLAFFLSHLYIPISLVILPVAQPARSHQQVVQLNYRSPIVERSGETIRH